MTKFTDSLDWLFSLEQFGIKFGLDGISAILEGLHHPERAFRSVHVAGTNGKGSVTAMVDAALTAAGHHSARYTSPHLVDLSERFVIGGRAVERTTLIKVVDDVRTVVEELRRNGASEVQPTFFEVTTAVAFELFRRGGVDVAVCEVGLGGRLDATNVLQPVVTAITSIGFDHQQYLGHTLSDIAFEKAGIIKRDTPVVVGRMSTEALRAIERVAGERNAPIVHAWEEVQVVRSADAVVGGGGIRLRTRAKDYGHLHLGLAGDHQISNAVVAVGVLETLASRGVAAPRASVIQGLTRVTWPGRLDLRRLPDGRELLLDAAHNPDGAAALAVFLTSKWEVKPPLVFAAMRDKDVTGMLRALAPAVSALVVTSASHPRSADPSALVERARDVAPDLPILIEPLPGDALTAAWRLSPRVVVAGSIFLLGDVLKELDRS